MVTIHGAPHGQKAYIQCGTAWSLKCVVDKIVVSTLARYLSL